MSEESGFIVLKASKKLTDKFLASSGDDVTNILKELFDYAGIETPTYEREGYGFDKAFQVSDYLCLKYGEHRCCEWSFIANSIVRHAKDVEVYARTYNEYGISRFLALNQRGKKFVYSIEGEDTNYDEAVEMINNWLDRIPDVINEDFPDLKDINIDSLLEYP